VVGGSLSGNHYEVLGLDSLASRERVDKAYRFHIELYDDAALATYSLLDPEEVRAARLRIQEAYDVLSDPVRRREYDVSLGLAVPGEPLLRIDSARPAAIAEAEPAPPHPGRRERLAGPVTGTALRRFREEHGISLHEIATISKVGVRFLEYIEQDRHSDLPAPVYLRGFLQEYARCVGLDPQATAEAYLARIQKQS
jgi:flagellar biosynthesis protein FlhG